MSKKKEETISNFSKSEVIGDNEIDNERLTIVVGGTPEVVKVDCDTADYWAVVDGKAVLGFYPSEAEAQAAAKSEK